LGDNIVRVSSMTSFAFPSANTNFNRGEVVALAGEVVGIPAPNGGELLSSDKLGPGLVELVTPEGMVCVHWVSAAVEVCLTHEDLRSLGKNAHLVTVKRYDRRATSSTVRYKIAAGLGFAHNWTVELRQPNIVRALRDDGSAWTFTYNAVFNRVDAPWEQPRDEDDAEALTAAELTTYNYRDLSLPFTIFRAIGKKRQNSL
jgi:hypothetical protein